jgi:hypothetical protein
MAQARRLHTHIVVYILRRGCNCSCSKSKPQLGLDKHGSERGQEREKRVKDRLAERFEPRICTGTVRVEKIGNAEEPNHLFIIKWFVTLVHLG